MRSDVIVLPEPFVDHDLGLLGGREPLSVENFMTKRSIKPLVVSVLQL